MENGAGLRRKDTTKGPPLRILSLDGGGVRGYSMFIILQELMHRTFVETEGRAPRREEIPKPCDHFDLIAGTGTGGLIAIMLGRLRLDIDTCKEVYVRMTRKVFETDKTFAGIPYRGTLFKASKLEEAIKECVAHHTTYDDEGNDSIATAQPMTPDTPGAGKSPSTRVPQRSPSVSSRYSEVGMSPVQPRTSLARWGQPNALLYDKRENRTKTAVTAVYKNTPPGGKPALLRSYDSRKEPAPEVNCTIWQAGRATSATGLAFKPIQIGQSVYIDEGAGKFNPSPQILDEAVINEYPGRDVGVFVSVGTGKRPGGTNNSQHLWWEGFVGGAMGDFAEARRRLISKIEGCEETHQHMLRDYLSKRGVNAENYYRFNVEVGVGEFGMNEWNRLSDISTSTRMYLARTEVTDQTVDAAAKIAKINLAKRRHDRQVSSSSSIQRGGERWDRPISTSSAYSGIPQPLAVELPGEDVGPAPYPTGVPGHRQFHATPSVANMKYSVISSDEYPQPVDSPYSEQQQYPPQQQQTHQQHHQSQRHSHQQQQDYPPPPSYRPNIISNHRQSDSSLTSNSSPKQSPVQQLQQQIPPPPRSSYDNNNSNTHHHHQAPAIPPKTPLPYPEQTNPNVNTNQRTFVNMGSLGRDLPYPDSDQPPPAVNTARKPEYGVR